MIQTFIVDWPVHLLLGLVFGAFATPHAWWRARAFRLGFVCSAVFAATAIVGYLVSSDWMWGYFLDPSDVAWSVPFVIAGFLFCFFLGFTCALALRPLGRGMLLLACGGAIGLEVLTLALTWDRYRMIGTATEFKAGEAANLLSLSPSGDAAAIAPAVPVFVVVLVVCLIAVGKDRRAPSAGR